MRNIDPRRVAGKKRHDYGNALGEMVSNGSTFWWVEWDTTGMGWVDTRDLWIDAVPEDY